MANAYQTAGRKFYVGNSTYLVDLSSFANSLEMAGDARIEKLTVVGSEGVESVPLTLTYNFRVPVMYYGDEPRNLEDHIQDEENIGTIIYPDTKSHMTMPVVFPGLGITAPTDNVLTSNVEFNQNNVLSLGVPDISAPTAKPRVFEKLGDSGNNIISAAGDVQEMAGASSGERVHFVCTKVQGTSPSIELSTTSGASPPGTTSAVTVTSEGIYYLGKIAKDPTSSAPAKVVAASPSTGVKVNGYILIGEEGQVD